MAAKKAGQVACTPKLASFSGRVRALIFSEQFGEELYQGQIKKLVNQHTGGLDAETLFAEFYEKYLNEYALAWSMRNSESDLRQQCKAYDVDDVTSCLKALLVFGSAQTTTCKIGLSDEMLFVRTQPIPGGMRMWGW